jgi:hypothetical protein
MRFFLTMATLGFSLFSISAQALWKSDDIREFLADHTCTVDVSDQKDRLLYSRNLNQELAFERGTGIGEPIGGDKFGFLAIDRAQNDFWRSQVFYITFDGGYDDVAVQFSESFGEIGWAGYNTTLTTLTTTGILIDKGSRQYHFNCR